jgi:hypothetical protein
MEKIKFTLGLLIGLSALTACKKGAEDPFLSLTSRKARISGEWKLESITSESSNFTTSGDTAVGSTSGNGSSIANHSETNFYTWDETYLINDYSFMINRDGTWSSIQDINFTSVIRFQTDTETRTGHNVYKQSGTWAFVHKTKDEYRDKERVTFYVTQRSGISGESTAITDYDDPLIASTTETTASSQYEQTGENAFDFFTYDLLMLKSKEMKWVKVSDYSLTNSYSTNSKEEIVWVAK